MKKYILVMMLLLNIDNLVLGHEFGLGLGIGGYGKSSAVENSLKEKCGEDESFDRISINLQALYKYRYEYMSCMTMLEYSYARDVSSNDCVEKWQVFSGDIGFGMTYSQPINVYSIVLSMNMGGHLSESEVYSQQSFGLGYFLEFECGMKRNREAVLFIRYDDLLWETNNDYKLGVYRATLGLRYYW